jgi:hypothetical protein
MVDTCEAKIRNAAAPAELGHFVSEITIVIIERELILD